MMACQPLPEGWLVIAVLCISAALLRCQRLSMPKANDRERDLAGVAYLTTRKLKLSPSSFAAPGLACAGFNACRPTRTALCVSHRFAGGTPEPRPGRAVFPGSKALPIRDGRPARPPLCAPLAETGVKMVDHTDFAALNAQVMDRGHARFIGGRAGGEYDGGYCDEKDTLKTETRSNFEFRKHKALNQLVWT